MDPVSGETLPQVDTPILVAVMDTVLESATVIPLPIDRPLAAAAPQELAEDPGINVLYFVGAEARLLRCFIGHTRPHNATGVTTHQITQAIDRDPGVHRHLIIPWRRS